VLAYPSREGVAEYRAYRQAIEQAAAEINEHWGHPGGSRSLDVADNRNRSWRRWRATTSWSATRCATG